MSKTSIFLHERLYISTSSRKKLCALHCKSFSKQPLFTSFSLILKVREVCNISSKCWLPNKSADKIFSHKTSYTSPLFQINILCYISYKCQLPNNLAKHQYFYIRDFLSLLHFEKKNSRPRLQKFFETSTFYHFFTTFKKWVRFVIFQVTADFLINQLQNIFTPGTLYSFFISKRKLRSPSENRSFYHISYYFKSEWGL